MRLPHAPNKGTPLEASWGRAVVEYMRSITPLGGPGVRVSRTANGTTITSKRQLPAPGQAVAAGGRRPFQLVPTRDDDGVAQLRITLSSLAGVVPEDFSAGDDPPYYLDLGASNEGIVGGKVTIDEETGLLGEDGLPEIIVESELPDDDDTAFHVLIGTFSVEEAEDPEDQPVITAANARYGPIHFVACRKWFVSEPPYWTPIWS